MFSGKVVIKSLKKGISFKKVVVKVCFCEFSSVQKISCLVRNTTPSISESKPSDLEMLQNDRLKLLHNPSVAFLNINSLKNKVID